MSSHAMKPREDTPDFRFRRNHSAEPKARNLSFLTKQDAKFQFG